MQSSFLASGTPWDTGLTKEGRRQRGKSQDCAGTSTIPCFVNVQRLCCCRCGRAGTRVMGTSVAREMGSQAPVPLLPHCLCPWTHLWLTGWSCGCHLACCSGFSVDLAPLQWSEGCEYRHCLCSLSSTSVWSHPPAFRGTAVWILRHPVVLGRGTFVGLWMF